MTAATPPTRFLPRCSGIAALGLMAVLCVAPAGATTLDPSHPVWDGPHAGAWSRALVQFGQDHVGRPTPRSRVLERGTAVGQRVLVIPVLPADAVGPPVSREDLERAWFGPGENSVRGYWNHVSGGRFAPTGRVLPWLRLPGSLQSDYPNVIDGRPVPNVTAGPRAMAADALDAAAAVVGDLRVFDDDGPDGIPGSGDDDGVLDLVVVLHPEPGWEVEPSDAARAIVSLQSRLDRRPIAGTDLAADAFVVTSARGPLGVWVHEFGHLLGLEDLYDHARDRESDTGGAEARLGGLGRWSLMASGTWGGRGSSPSGLDAWSRIRLGWDDTRITEGDAEFDLVPVDASGGSSLEVRPTGDWGFERFVLETRRRRPDAIVDADLPGSGVLVYRVDGRQGDLGLGSDYLELLQADGRDDLGNGDDDGDADDPFDGSAGADRLDATTNPATVSGIPDPARPAPVIEIGPADAAGAHRVQVGIVDGPWLRLRSAAFPQPQEQPRTFIGLERSTAWRLEFDDVGAQPVTNAEIDLEILPTGRNGSVEPSTGITLQRNGAMWSPAPTVVVTEEDGLAGEGPLDVRITLRVDDRPARTIELGIPVQLGPGLSNDLGLEDFVPRVLSAATDTTRFERLGLADLPRTTSAGWGLRTDGELRYADDVEVAVESGWTGFGEQRELEFWSRQDVERDLPGMTWDAGVVEVFVPDRGWRVVEPSGRDVVQVWRASSAAVRARAGLGGQAWIWEPTRMTLPDDALPLRVRFRFGSDSIGTARGWQIAGAGTLSPLPRAALTVRPREGGGLEVRTDFDGDLAPIDQVRFRYRRPGAETWIAASPLFSVRSDATTVNPIDVPASVDVFEVGLFSEIAGDTPGGSTPPLLLGRAGYRRSPERALPRLLTNPAVGQLVLETPVRDEDVALRVIDVRGREVAQLTIPAGTDLLEWNGRSAEGARLGSGVYFLVLSDDPSRAISFVWLN
ncbi:MAG TPA: M6 family metalloprotease domain-containing protein [Candidatus Krumholzibacteria bacterium]|nr:M6 family metalloprotease domain-containing protein [Candidatus Krumholzibacteria bacterium]